MDVSRLGQDGAMAARDRRRGSASLLLSAVVTACGAVSLDPEEIASRLPPERELGEVDAARLERLTSRAMLLLDEGSFGQAEEVARQALTIQPRAARPRAVLGTCLMQKANRDDPPDLRLWRQAEGELLAASRTAPADTLVSVMYGCFLMADGHLVAAAEVAEAALGRDADHLEALRLAAEARYELGEERLARPHLTRLVQLDPDPQIVYRLAWCLLRLSEGDPDNELALLLESADGFYAYRESEPTDVEGYLGEGRAWLRAAEETADADRQQERAERALSVFEQAAARFAENAAAQFGLGVCLEILGRYDAAIEAYDRALELDPHHTGALLNLAASYAATGRKELAEPLCRRALEEEDLTSDERRRVLEFLDGR